MKAPYALMAGLLLFSVNPALAVMLPPVPTEPLYFEPPVEQADEQVQTLSCPQLDLAINQLHPYRYSYKPGFYEDGLNRAAVGLVAIDAVPLNGLIGLGYLGYSQLVTEKEERRVLLVEQKIAMLQRIKANKHCYE